MNTAVISRTGELIAYISDKHDNIIKDGYEIINYGNSEPVLEDKGGKIYVKDNAFTVDLKDGDIKE